MMLLVLVLCGRVVFAAPRAQLYNRGHELIDSLADDVLAVVLE